MRPSQISMTRARRGRGAVSQCMTVIGATAALGVGLCSPASGAAPPPCAGVVQISDDTGDGHHDNTDVLSAWFSEQAGRLQAVIKVARGDWRPMHVDADAAGWAVLFEVAGQTRFVRAEAPKGAPIRYDHGTWTLAGGFVSAGPATGEVTAGPAGTATIDVPAEIGALAGTLLARPFALTYEHEPAAAAHWVDRAPGGVTPTEAAFGADYVVGSCQPAAPAAPVATGGDVPAAGGAATTGVVLYAPKRLVGEGRARARGRIVPARAG